MAQTVGVAAPQPQQPGRTNTEQPALKGKVLPLPGAAKETDAREQAAKDQELVAVLSFFMM